MPRPRKSTNVLIKRRTRTGCQTCRARKLKCSEEKPVCRQCLLKGLNCDTTTALKWETDYVSKGLKFGRAGVWSKDPYKTASPSPTSDWSTHENAALWWCPIPDIYPYSFVNTTVDTLHELDKFEAGIEGGHPHRVAASTLSEADAAAACYLSPWPTTQSLVRSGQPRIASSLSILPPWETPEQSSLLSYYVERICPMTISSLTSVSPFATLLLPFAISTSSLTMDSMLALAACHRSRTESHYKAMALGLSHRALRALRTMLRDGDSTSIIMVPETLVVMLLLCMFEIVNECDSRWVVHLKGARDLIRIRRSNQPTFVQHTDAGVLALFCERFFAFQDIMGRTACGEDPVFGSDFWANDQTNCEPWLGCSPQLVSILSRITELGRQDPLSRQTTEFQAAAAALEAQLSMLKQTVLDYSDDILSQSGELKRLAAEVYLQCALNGASPSTPWVSQQVSKILRLISISLESRLVSGISWPLFIAAVELHPHQDLELYWEAGDAPKHARAFILYVLEMLTGSMVNTVRIRTVIEKVWQARELREGPASASALPESDWEQFVAPFCGNMSLA
ncbi:Fungal specific transcription factor domain-containing protein [Cladophialophora immunda]|nr:Fungal specific transcription factor domain-containing protein [Cladophialophora immunda]